MDRRGFLGALGALSAAAAVGTVTAQMDEFGAEVDALNTEETAPGSVIDVVVVDDRDISMYPLYYRAALSSQNENFRDLEQWGMSQAMDKPEWHFFLKGDPEKVAAIREALMNFQNAEHDERRAMEKQLTEGPALQHIPDRSGTYKGFDKMGVPTDAEVRGESIGAENS